MFYHFYRGLTLLYISILHPYYIREGNNNIFRLEDAPNLGGGYMSTNAILGWHFNNFPIFRGAFSIISPYLGGDKPMYFYI